MTSSDIPRKLFTEQIDRFKRKYVIHLRETTTSDVLIYVAKHTLYVELKRSAVHVVSQISFILFFYLFHQNVYYKKVKCIYPNTKSYLTLYTENEALGFMVDTCMIKNSYHLT